LFFQESGDQNSSAIHKVQAWQPEPLPQIGKNSMSQVRIEMGNFVSQLYTLTDLDAQ
jgi:hypothetical protein